MRAKIREIINSSKDTINLGELNISDEEIEEIATLIVNTKPDTKEIFLNSNLLDNEGAQTLATQFQTLKHLTILDLQSNHIDIEGAKAIYSLLKINPKLNILFRDNNIQDVEVIDHIKNSYTHSKKNM